MEPKRSSHSRALVAIVLLLTCNVIVSPSNITKTEAATSTTLFALTVTGGGLSITTQATTLTASGVTLNGSINTSLGTLNNVSIIDSRGSGAGWTNQIQTADLSATITGTSHQIPFLGLTLGAQAPVISDISSSPTSGISAQINTLSGTDTTPGVTLSSLSTLLVASAGNGLGSYTDTVSLTQSVPANTYAPPGGSATYSTNLVFSVQ